MRAFPGALCFGFALLAPLVVPEVILGLSLLLLFVACQSWFGWPSRGMLTITVAHATFGACFVSVLVRAQLAGFDRALEEAALDLGARPWTVLTRITLPGISPALVSGWLLAFTLSLDDLVIASFVTGPSATTLPMAVFSSVRLGVSPEVNALATLFLAVVFVLVAFAGWLMARDERRRHDHKRESDLETGKSFRSALCCSASGWRRAGSNATTPSRQTHLPCAWGAGYRFPVPLRGRRLRRAVGHRRGRNPALVAGAGTRAARNPETDQIQVRVNPAGEDQIEPSGVVSLADASLERLQIIANVLSKSLVLGHSEARIAGVFDRIEPLAVGLQRKGRPGAQARDLLRQIGDVLLTQHRMVGRVEVEEKPDVLWDHPELERLYARLEDEYELVERSRAMERKLALISETAGTLIELVHNQRSLRLEWYIIGLIGLELLLSLYGLVSGGLPFATGIAR